MKKIMSLFLALVLTVLGTTVAFATNEDEINLITENTEKLYIVIPKNANENEKFASNILCEKLEKIYDIDAVTVKDNKAVSGKVICVGDTIYNNSNLSDKKSGSYTITAVDNGISIYGNGNRGLLDGVYRFLSDFCDYEVYTKDVISFTDEETLSVPDDVNIEYSPYFEYRKVDTTSSYNEEYCRANSINASISVPNYEGGSIGYISGFCHTFTDGFCSKDKYFESNPEYFALHNGERTSDQLCLTNPKVLEIVTQEVFDVLEKRWDKNADLQIISLTQADNQNYCECDKCKALDEANGSHAGTMITFANAVADKVKEAGYDNVCIDTFAYQYTRACPTNVVPRDNVIVRLCSIECCFGHTLDDATCEENVEFMKDLKNWSNICDHIYIWDYVNNYWHTLLPFANFQVLQRNMQIFYENGAKGVYEEGNYYMYKCNGEFYELRSYLLSKLMQDPYRDDFDELMNNYLVNVYGPGGTYIREFIDLMSKRSVTKRNHLSISQNQHTCLAGITTDEIYSANKMWENAKAMAQTEQQLNEIERSELCWQYWKACKCVCEYSPARGLYNYMKEHKALYDKMVAFGITALGENESLHTLRGDAFYVYFLTPSTWMSRNDGKFWHVLDPFAEKLYELLSSIY